MTRPRAARRLAILLAGLIVPMGVTLADGAPARDILWRIISNCLDTTVPDYCARCGLPLQGHCGPSRGCSASTELWAETREYVAIRDIKMCGCPVGFVHGLAMPRRRITGVEDGERPAGIWAFAWETARHRIADEREIALVVNPPRLRTQDQLHVHVLRLKPDARSSLAGAGQARVGSLDEVWQAAARVAGATDDYGVLVALDAGGGFVVVVERESPEQRFTLSECK